MLDWGSYKGIRSETSDVIERTVEYVYRYRLSIIMLIQGTLVVLANQTAFWLRFDGHVPADQQPYNMALLPLLLCVRLAVFFPLRLHRGLWRYASIWDLGNIVIGVVTSSVLFWVIVGVALGITTYHRSIVMIDAMLLICLMGGVRLGRRICREVLRSGRGRRTLVFGAGDAGEMIARDMKNNSHNDYEPIGFVDDDPRKIGTRIHGVPVLGTRQQLGRIIETSRPQEILVAMPSVGPTIVREIVRALEPYKIPIKTLPHLSDRIGGRLLVSQIRSLKIEDLLTRPAVGLTSKPLRSLVKGKGVLVTGAGGSIGSELCSQIMQLDPKVLILYDRYENGLFAAANNLAGRSGQCSVQTMVGDITDRKRVDNAMGTHQPAIVFHAAAHKHVPLMEQNPCEAVKNNVFGTRTVMEAAARHDVERFIFISTDKAVNPTSVMGATKRVGELLIQATNHHRARTAYVAVRFGNVLASNGSVVPTFIEQIKAGGPVTVTHPDIRRYFMLIPEAVQLVLHAAVAEAGSVYVLDMGEPVKLVDMARSLIRLSGFVPDEEIEIVFTGLRPGEKLFEELVGGDESSEASGLDKIVRVRPQKMVRFEELNPQIAELERLAADGDVEGTLCQLACIVPSFQGALAATEGLRSA